MSKAPVADRQSLELLVASLPEEVQGQLRMGSMFGWPAAYVGKKLAFCVKDDKVGIKVSEDVATQLINSGTAIPFRPYGKPPMREWVEMTISGDVSRMIPVLTASVDFLANTN